MAKEILLQAAELGSQYGTTAFQEYFEERKNYFLPQLQSILIELNGLYSSTIKEGEVDCVKNEKIEDDFISDYQMYKINTS